MCGRYYVDGETAKEIKRLVLKLDQKICSESDQTAAVFPSQKATVITGRGRHLEAEQMIWGPPRFDGRGILTTEAEGDAEYEQICQFQRVTSEKIH